MILGITSIQKNRGKYILEWIAFHLAVGFNKFYIYNHGSDPLQIEILIKLSEKFPDLIHATQIGDAVDRPQITAYQHSWANNKNLCDAMAFIDGDEFLFSPNKNLPSELSKFFENDVSALGVYWMIYGSSGHYKEPEGLIIENFKRHARPDFHPNRHIKTILKGGEDSIINHSHIFNTSKGTYDELNRIINHPIVNEFTPSIETFRINHYTIQSYEYFKNKKQNSGQADLPRAFSAIRPDEHFHQYDRNDCDDGKIYNQIIKTKIQLEILSEAIKI